MLMADSVEFVQTYASFDQYWDITRDPLSPPPLLRERHITSGAGDW